MNIYGYCRISTAKQSIDRQIRNIKAEYPTAHIVQEAYTGTSIFRPEWLKLYRVLKAGDTVVFDSVSRMSRNAEEGFALYEDLYHKGIRLVFLKEHHIDTETYKKALSGSIAMTGTNVDFILKGINEYLMALAKEQIKLAFEQSEKEVADVRMLGNRLEPLLQHDVFERRQNGSSSLPISPHIHIFDVSSYPDTIRTTLAELLLYDWFRSARALQIPIVIMVDEVQNLRLGRGTVLNRIITEGRKFSIGSILISQSLKGFAPDEQLALSQTGTKLFFKPPLTEIRACSEMLAEPVRRSGTVELLKKLKVGQCLLLSDFTHIGDSLQPSSDCIQVSINFPTSIIE